MECQLPVLAKSSPPPDPGEDPRKKYLPADIPMPKLNRGKKYSKSAMFNPNGYKKKPKVVSTLSPVKMNKTKINKSEFIDEETQKQLYYKDTFLDDDKSTEIEKPKKSKRKDTKAAPTKKILIVEEKKPNKRRMISDLFLVRENISAPESSYWSYSNFKKRTNI